MGSERGNFSVVRELDIPLDLSLFGGPVVVVDTETTGIGKADRVVEIAAVRFEEGRCVGYSSLVNPQRHIPSFAEAVHGISNDMVANEPLFGEIFDAVRELLVGAVVVAHNLPFDRRMIEQEASRLGWELNIAGICTLTVARRMHPERGGKGAFTLGALLNLYDIENDAAHRALGDAEATARLFAKMVQRSPEVVERYLPR